MILRWPTWLKPVTMTAKDIKMKVLAENLTINTKCADEQEARQYSGDDEPMKLIVKPGENK